MNPNINKAIDIFNSEDPVSAILENRDFFPFIEKEMMGVAHPKVHCEGDVWDHTALVINKLREGHDWVDVMIALFHDAGKKRALDKNEGKNMAGHELYSLDVLNEWIRNEVGGVIPNIVPLHWVIENHMNALVLGQMKSRFRIMQIVTNQWFPRLHTLADADCKATIGEDGKPAHDFMREVLLSPKVSRWVGQCAPAPIANENDFYEADVPLNFTRAAVEFGLKLQVNGNITDRQHIINGVLGDKAFRGTIADWHEKCDQRAEKMKKDTDNETA